MTIKICGIRSREEARAALEAGASALGFHVALPRARSPLSVSEAKEIIGEIGAACAVVVTAAGEPQELADIAQETDAHTLQLCGDVSPETIRTLKEACPQVNVWKVIGVREGAIEKAKRFEHVADAIVLDSAGSDGEEGGTGKTHDWSESRRIVEVLAVPVILAGGLRPDNVAEAIRTAGPAGVDVNSGVSNSDGSKDHTKVKLFIERAKMS